LYMAYVFFSNFMENTTVNFENGQHMQKLTECRVACFLTHSVYIYRTEMNTLKERKKDTELQELLGFELLVIFSQFGD